MSNDRQFIVKELGNEELAQATAVAQEFAAEAAAARETGLTAFNCLAFDIARREAHLQHKVLPCWLVTSDEAKRAYRARAVEVLKEHGHYFGSVANAEATFERSVPRHLVESWIKAEREFEAIRKSESPNPRAFFAEYGL